MELQEAMRTAATVRRFRRDPIADDVLYRVLDAARFAPSGGNQQGWRVVVVRDTGTKGRLKELYLRVWRPLYQARIAAGAPGGPHGARRPGTEAGNDYAEHMDELPVHLVVVVEVKALATPFQSIRESNFLAGSSIYPFVQNVLLAARNEGLGAALTMLLNEAEPEVKELLAIPEGVALVAHIGLGWPAEPHPTRLTRRPVEEFAFVERFAGSPFRDPGSR